jgi:hypothetical protein
VAPAGGEPESSENYGIQNPAKCRNRPAPVFTSPLIMTLLYNAFGIGGLKTQNTKPKQGPFFSDKF